MDLFSLQSLVTVWWQKTVFFVTKMWINAAVKIYPFRKKTSNFLGGFRRNKKNIQLNVGKKLQYICLKTLSSKCACSLGNETQVSFSNQCLMNGTFWLYISLIFTPPFVTKILKLLNNACLWDVMWKVLIIHKSYCFIVDYLLFFLSLTVQITKNFSINQINFFAKNTHIHL